MSCNVITYTMPVNMHQGFCFLTLDYNECSREPGELVKHYMFGGLGMIIAIDTSRVTILWAIEPNFP